MAKLAIQGHETRGKEVIQLLEMLGGKSNGNMNGYNDDLYYYIAKDDLNCLDIQTENAYKAICIEEKNLNNDVYNKDAESIIILDLKRFNAENIAIQKRLILYSINKIFGTTKGIEKIHIEDIIKLCNNNIGNKFLTPNKKTKIVIKNKKIIISDVK